MKRLILAILAAIVINVVLAAAIDHVFHTTGVYPPYGEPMFDTNLLLLALSYRVLITIFAAYITAMIAQEKTKTALWTSAIIGTAFWLIGAIAMSEYGPVWYSIAGALTVIPLVLFGGKLYGRRARQSADKNVKR